MVRPDQDRIGAKAGEHVEVDEAYVGGRTRGEGRGVHHKTLVTAAVEVRHREPGKRRELAPATEAAFFAFSQQVFAEGALTAKIKQIIAVAGAHFTQCPCCIKGHTGTALRHGASPEELMAAIWVAAEMRSGGSFAHTILTMTEIEKSSAPEVV